MSHVREIDVSPGDSKLTKFGSSYEKFDVWPRVSVIGGPDTCGWRMADADGKLRIEKIVDRDNKNKKKNHKFGYINCVTKTLFFCYGSAIYLHSH